MCLSLRQDARSITLTHNLTLCCHHPKKDFRGKRHDLLDCHNGKFDRDFAEFNARIAELEAALQGFINQVQLLGH